MKSDHDVASAHERTYKGAHRFHKKIFQADRKIYEAASKGQAPHTLFIACSDSRVAPEAITQSGCGEIFVTRNIGNMVPAYGESFGSTAAVIEYAVAELKVSQIIVCGHSGCGAMKALLSRKSVAELRAVDQWLRNAEAAVSSVRAANPKADKDALLPKLVEANVLLQLSQLQTHPSVAARLATKELSVCGWVFEIGEGLVKELDSARNEFVPIT